MKRIALSLFSGIALLLPLTVVNALDEPDFLRFSFRIHCEEEDTTCDPKDIDEDADMFSLKNFVLNQPMSIDLVIDNPQKALITSARAKLKYDPLMLDVVRFDMADSDFQITAPGEDVIDQDEGTLLIGRSFTGGSRGDAEFVLATIRLTPIATGGTLEFMNFQNTELGDTAIIFVQGVLSENLLKVGPKPLVFGDGTDQQVDIGGPPDKSSLLPRPEGLRIQTDDQGNVRLIWPIGEDPPVKGYYLYYGQQGNYYYLRRRDVGRTNFALFPDLPRGKKYYFSITAYDFESKESEHSEEVSVYVGQPGTESHPFEGEPEIPGEGDDTDEPEPPPADPPKTPDNGPEHIFFFLVISFGVAFIGYSLRRRTP